MIFVFRRKSGEGEGPAAQTDQNFEELAGSMQGCKLAGARSGGGEPHSKTASTSKLTWDWATTTTSSSSEMMGNSDLAMLIRHAAWGHATLQEATGTSSDLVVVPVVAASVDF